MSVYFVKVGDHIKIGFSRNPERRIRNLFASATRYAAPAGTPTTLADREVLGIIPGSTATERLIHAALDDFAVGAEWFVDEPEVRELIERAELLDTFPVVTRPAGPVDYYHDVEGELFAAAVMDDIFRRSA